ncbi:MAG: DMT family transporter [Anaerolineae bacterium]|nr:DMT family transporter [Anaerolineae bacterium]
MFIVGALWAAAAGVGFGVFQTVNRQAVRGLDVYLATFIQLLVSTLVLVAISAFTEDVTQLTTASIAAWIYFALAGFVHFFVGWTFLNASQKMVGAARTSSLIGTIPLFGIVLAALTLGEFPTVLAVVGMVVIMGGVYLVNYARLKQEVSPNPIEGQASGWRSLLPGLVAALCWALSPIFIRFGLAELPSPMLGLTIGITVSTIGYGVVLAVRGLSTSLTDIPADTVTTKVIAGVLVGLATWAYWVAFGLASVALVLALALLSVPVVNLLSPIIVGRDLEQVTGQVWLGSALIIGGSLILIFFQ